MAVPGQERLRNPTRPGTLLYICAVLKHEYTLRVVGLLEVIGAIEFVYFTRRRSAALVDPRRVGVDCVGLVLP